MDMVFSFPKEAPSTLSNVAKSRDISLVYFIGPRASVKLKKATPATRSAASLPLRRQGKSSRPWKLALFS